MLNWWTDRQTDGQTMVISYDSLYVGDLIIKLTLSFPEFISTNQNTSLFHEVTCEIQPIFFNQFLISINLYQYAKNQNFS